jgi:pyruvate formate lyase activating enzyme
MLRLHSFETMGTQEGPGIRLLVFLQGCNAECVYCHNPDTWPIKAGKLVNDNYILNRVKKEMPYFKNNGGVTFSGGDPIVQMKELIPLMKKLKKMKIHTALETNCSIFNENAKELLKYTDLLLLDLKHINPNWRKKITGINFDPLKFADYCEKNKKPFWLRYVLMPEFTDQKEYLNETALAFKKYKMLERVEILRYHKEGISKYNEMGIEYKYKEIPIPSEENVEKAKNIFSKYLKNVVVR